MSNEARTRSSNAAASDDAVKPVTSATGGSVENSSEEARQTMNRLCIALSTLIEGLPERPTRATDVANVLGINPQLAWQVFKMAGAADALSAVQYLPTSNQLRRVIKAADAAGARPDTVHDAQTACTALDGFILAHAKDRREFESLIGSLARGSAEQVDTKHRRAIYRGHAHYYGLQAQTVYCCNVVHPAEAGGGYRQFYILGYVGLHALRPDVPMTLFQKTVAFDPAGDAVQVPSGVRILDGFGSGRRVKLVHEGDEDGRVYTRIVFPGVGRKASISFLSIQDFNEASTAQDPDLWLSMQITVPAESIVMDYLLPAEWGTSGQATVTTYARRAKPSKVMDYRSVDIIPCNDQATCNRGVTELAPTSDVPGVREAIGRVIREKGWGGTKYDHYRCRVAYPVLYSAIRLSVLPPKVV